jgi:glycine/D-amino acid oxidase-like deaminating enzyme
MKRADFFRKIWLDCKGALPMGSAVAVAGAGPSGLMLALALAEYGMLVTLYDPKRTGGLRIPLMHACFSRETRSRLWETAAAHSRTWYQTNFNEADGVYADKSTQLFFTVRLRQFLRTLLERFESHGGKVVHGQCDPKEVCTQYRMVFFAAGASGARQFFVVFGGCLRHLTGSESYIRRPGESEFDTNVNPPDSIAEWIKSRSRAAFIHLNATQPDAARKIAHELYTRGRHALFADTRLTSRDRQPVVGFTTEDRWNNYDACFTGCKYESFSQRSLKAGSTFLFTAMGYHALTYAPYLADQVAKWLTGTETEDQNLVCALSPARFLP